MDHPSCGLDLTPFNFVLAIKLLKKQNRFFFDVEQ